MVLRPTRTVEEAYAGGQKLYAYLIELVVFKPITFNPNDSGNIDMLESVDEISEWIQKQIDEENHPVPQIKRSESQWQ